MAGEDTEKLIERANAAVMSFERANPGTHMPATQTLIGDLRDHVCAQRQEIERLRDELTEARKAIWIIAWAEGGEISIPIGAAQAYSPAAMLEAGSVANGDFVIRALNTSQG